MQWNKTYHRKKICVFFFCVLACAVILLGRLVYLMIFRGDYYSKLATDLQQRERQIKAARGKILDRNGVVLAGNKSVCTISVIHNQIEEPEKVIQMLCKELGISEEKVRKRVEKRSSIERIKSNVDKETGNRILAYGFAGVKVDEDYKREYPFDELGSKVLGFTGGDNQGIIGLETVYDEELQGTDGTILTTTDARGVEVDNIGEERVEPVAGNNLRLTMDTNIQKFAEQAAQKAFIQKEADSVSILVMNPQNGEMLAMVDYISRENDVPLCEEYNEYRKQKLTDILYPASVLTAAAVSESETIKNNALNNAIPEFMRFNIVESEVRNVN